jgi:hypothetical protein
MLGPTQFFFKSGGFQDNTVIRKGADKYLAFLIFLFAAQTK